MILIFLLAMYEQMNYINQNNFETFNTLRTLPFYSTELQGYFFKLNCQMLLAQTAQTAHFGRHCIAKLQDITERALA